MDPDALYDLPAGAFVAARDALVKELRAAGRRDEAREVAALRRPSVAAAVVNRLSRARGAALDELFAAGDAVRAAQTALLAGGADRAALRRAIADQREAVERLVAHARALAGEHGDPPAPAVLEKVAETLQAAALDDDAREQVRGGRLTRELRHVGLGFGDGGSAAPAPAAARRAKPAKAKTKTKTPKPEKPKPEKPKPEPKPDRDAARKALRREVAAARRTAETAARRVTAAQARHDRAAQALAEAQAALDDATAAAAQADAARADAQTRLRDA